MEIQAAVVENNNITTNITTNTPDLKEMRTLKSRLYHQIRYNKSRGKDVTGLQTQLEALKSWIQQEKTGSHE